MTQSGSDIYRLCTQYLFIIPNSSLWFKIQVSFFFDDDDETQVLNMK